MGCATSRLRSKVDVRDLENSVRTGDLILFSSKHASAQVTKCFTASEWDHIGLVVKFSSKHVYILEYAGGVYLYPLFTRLYTYYAIQGRNISLRRLLPGQDREAMQQKVETFVRTVLGHSPPSIQEMVVAVLKQETYISSFVSKMAGGGGEKDNALTVANSAPVEDDLQTLFCSKLIAAVYKDVGLISPNRVSSDFLPKHFSQSYDGYLDLQKGALLGPELPINFESVKDEIEALQRRLAEEKAFKSEHVVRAVSEFYVNSTKDLKLNVSRASGGFANMSGPMANVSGSFTNLLEATKALPQQAADTFYKVERGLHGHSEDAEAAMKMELGAGQSGKQYPSVEAQEQYHGEIDLSDAPADEPMATGDDNASDASTVGASRTGGIEITRKNGGSFMSRFWERDDGGIYTSAPSKAMDKQPLLSPAVGA